MDNIVRQEDIRKLHAEINQAVNQRFLTTTAALTLFGVMVAVAAPNAGNDKLVLLLSALLIGGLFLIYIQSHHLRRVVYRLATYLTARRWSEYEEDLAELREVAPRHQTYTAYTKAQTVVFVILGLAASLLPCMIRYATDKDIQTAHLLVGTFGFCVAAIIAGMGFNEWFIDIPRLERNWKVILVRKGRLPRND